IYMENYKRYIPGILFTLIISLSSILLNNIMKKHINLEALTLAIIIGILYNNLIGVQAGLEPGVKFTLKKLLKVGIVLLGFKLSISSLFKLGPTILIMVVIYVISALLLSYLLGRVFKIDSRLSALLGVGSCICGASAVVAMAPCINAEDEDAVVAVSIVSFLGAIGVIAYSAIAVSGISISPTQYGVWSGISLHGVAHALAAAFALGDLSGEMGTFVKMTRVLMLVPVSLILSMVFAKKNGKREKAKFPTYVLFFVLAGIINSVGIIPESLTKLFVQTSSLLILMAMTAMGLSVNFKDIVNRGIGALVASTILFITLSGCSLIAILKLL
ncbi:MAG: putative sulfate exporter family transporter, partial [Peptostreptococcaceae bacterium]|nr:putative sulfate exporter family transporter [Peptostreptococcaceae bacterium]